MSPHKKPQGGLEITRSDSQSSSSTDSMLRDSCDRSSGAGPSVLPVQPLVDAASSSSAPSSLGASRPPVALTGSLNRRPRSNSFMLEARQRERFLIFIKILFKSLGEREPNLHARAKRIVAECTRRNRVGDPDFDPLMAAVEQRLRHMVGETHWMRATAYMRHYMTHMRERKQEGAPTDRRPRKQRQQEQD